MSDQQKLTIALRHVLETSTAALAFLTNPPENVNQSLDGTNLSLLHKDFLSLLSFIYASTTKLSLVLKPSSPSLKAALEPLKELSDRIASLPYCVRLLQIDYGKSLAAEASTITKDVLDALNSLVQTFLDIETGVSSGGRAGSEYLVKTGAVHEIIDKARSQGGFSGNNLTATRKVLKSNQEALDDGLAEVRQTMETAEKPEDGKGDGEEYEDLDDGWVELGIFSNNKPSITELRRIQKIYAIIRLSTLLHQRISKDVLSTLSPPLPLSKEINTILDDLADASSEFLSASDNFISTMYPPQVTEHMNTELEAYQGQLTRLQSKLDPLIPDASLTEQLQNLQLFGTAKSSDHYMKLRKWYIACINQIDKNIHELKDELKRSETAVV